MRMHMRCINAMDVVDVLESGHGTLTSAGWKPGNVDHFHRMERMDQPADQVAMHRVREQRLGALIARRSQSNQCQYRAAVNCPACSREAHT